MDYYFENDKTEKIEEVSKTRKSVKEAFEWLDAVIFSIIAIIILFTFVFRIVGIRGDSMKETLHEGDRIVISNIFYTPKQGDIVVISRNYTNENGSKDQNDSPIIKRVIATEGQTITIDPENRTVAVDGKVLNEPYVNGQITNWPEGENVAKSITVEDNHIFVLGDNRGESLDSRYSVIGQVDERYILGKALIRIFPFDSFGGF